MTLDELALQHGTDKSSQFHNYTVKYERIFSGIKDRVRKVLELGVLNGASLRMWRDYFEAATIYGFDVNPECKKQEGDRISVVIGNENNGKSLLNLASLGPFDLVVDDASHHCRCQITSFSVLWKSVAPGGMYVIEDAFTSYDPSMRGPGMTAINFFKGLVDWVNFHDSREHFRGEKRIIPTLQGKASYPLDVYSVSFFNGFIVVEKRT